MKLKLKLKIALVFSSLLISCGSKTKETTKENIDKKDNPTSEPEKKPTPNLENSGLEEKKTIEADLYLSVKTLSSDDEKYNSEALILVVPKTDVGIIAQEILVSAANDVVSNIVGSTVSVIAGTKAFSTGLENTSIEPITKFIGNRVKGISLLLRYNRNNTDGSGVKNNTNLCDFNERTITLKWNSVPDGTVQTSVFTWASKAAGEGKICDTILRKLINISNI